VQQVHLEQQEHRPHISTSFAWFLFSNGRKLSVVEREKEEKHGKSFSHQEQSQATTKVKESE